MRITNNDIEFLSNRELSEIVGSILDELEMVANVNAFRSMTFLAVSAIEGLARELIKLLDIKASDVKSGTWPPKKSKPKPTDELDLYQMEKILKEKKALPVNFETFYEPVRIFRNYMHPDRELREREPIKQSVAQAAVACLNALIEMYSDKRFVAGQKWLREKGKVQVPSNNIIEMVQIPGEYAAFLVSEEKAKKIKKIEFDVYIPPNAIFDIVYNYFSLNRWMAARIEGRLGQENMGYDNGLVECLAWNAWTMSGRYKKECEPNPNVRRHNVAFTLNPSKKFEINVDGKSLELDSGVEWNYDPNGQIGFMAEAGTAIISSFNVEIK